MVMKIARLAILGVSLAAGLLVARTVLTTGPEPVAEPVVAEQEVDRDEVLVADRDIALGTAVQDGDMALGRVAERSCTCQRDPPLHASRRH